MTDTPTPCPTPTPIASPQPSGTAPAPLRASRPRRTWDLVLTSVLAGGVFVGTIYLVAATLGLLPVLFLSCLLDEACNEGALLLRSVGFALPILVASHGLATAVVLLVVRRIAFWVPIVTAPLVWAAYEVAIRILTGMPALPWGA